MALQRVAAVDDLWGGELLACEAGGRKLVLVRIDDTVHAYEDRCAHLSFPLSRGELHGAILTCAAHHWRYDLRTGCGVNPASARLTRVPVTLRDGQILVETGAMGSDPIEGRDGILPGGGNG